jgi:hypothetical protein
MIRQGDRDVSGRSAFMMDMRLRPEWPQRMAQARATGDLASLAELSLQAARGAREADDPQEARWHLQRADLALTHSHPDEQGIRLLADLVEESVALASHWAALAELGEARRQRELARDRCFVAIRHTLSTGTGPVRVAGLLRLADLLDALGDGCDADSLRERAFAGLSALPLGGG